MPKDRFDADGFASVLAVHMGRTRIVYGDTIDQPFREAFEASLEKATRTGDRLFEIERAGRDILIVADNARELEALVREHSPTGPSFSDLRRNIRSDCDSFRNFHGRSAPGIAYFCKAPGSQLQAGIEQALFDFLVGRTHMFLTQYQLSGAIRVSEGQGEILRREGPLWLSSGLGQVFGNRVALGLPSWDFRIVMYRRLEREFPDLADLETTSAFEALGADAARAGTVGAADLIDLEWYPAIMKMYEALGLGAEWPAVFTESFGLSLDEFYDFYRNVDRFREDGTPRTGVLTRE